MTRLAQTRELEQEPGTMVRPLSPVPALLPEAQVMIGTHHHCLDEKGRVIIPQKLRAALTNRFWMILDQDSNIGLYNHETGFDVMAHCERLMEEHPEDEALAAAVKKITSRAEQVAVDSGWRVPVPDFLREKASLVREVVTVGVLNHAVLCSKERWHQAEAQQMEGEAVRRAQATILRGAASGSARRSGRTQIAGAATHGGDGSSAEAASSRDGGRSSRLLAL